MKNNKLLIARYSIAFCLIAGLALLCVIFIGIFADFSSGTNSDSTVLEFNVENPSGMGFKREVTLYTENGITSVNFKGKLTVTGSAEIIIIANDDGKICFSQSFTNTNSKDIEFSINDLLPYTYYTLNFVSSDAKKGKLILMTDESLIERPAPPKKHNYILSLMINFSN